MFRFGDPGGRMYGSVGASDVNLLALWTNAQNLSPWTVSAGNGRATGSCLRIAGIGGLSASWVSKVLDNQATWGVALAIRTSELPNAGSRLDFITLLDGGSTQVTAGFNSDGTLSVTRNGTVLGTTGAAVSLNAWVHVELKVLIDPSAGTVYLAVNGAQKLNLTAQNTRATANSRANEVRVGTSGPNMLGNYNLDFDDVIVYDGQATDANGLADITGPIGDCGLAWLLPTGPGTTTQFTPDTGSNYARVNEATPDGDTSYVESATVGQIDTYAAADLPAAGAVKSLAAVHYARKTDVGARGLKSVLRSGGANATHAAELPLGNTYQYLWSTWAQDPNNGAPQNWTPAAVNALEAGQAVSS